MARREVQVIECDGCRKTVEYNSSGSKDLPANWHRIVMQDFRTTLDSLAGRVWEFDAHSPGCAERVAISAIRSFYGISDEPPTEVTQLTPIADDEPAAV